MCRSLYRAENVRLTFSIDGELELFTRKRDLFSGTRTRTTVVSCRYGNDPSTTKMMTCPEAGLFRKFVALGGGTRARRRRARSGRDLT